MPRESIRQRAVYVYAPSVQMLEDWRNRARKAHVPLSKFVLEHVNNSIRQEEDTEYQPRSKLIAELREKNEAIDRLSRENEITKLALERLEDELRKYRAAPFLDSNFRGIRRYDRKLIELLKKGEVVDSDLILRLLRINPRETELVKAVSNQLGNLETYGLVEKTRRGWRWIGE